MGDYFIGIFILLSFCIKGFNINFLFGGGCDVGKI